MKLEQVDRYRILRQMARGAAGERFLAHDPESRREVEIQFARGTEGAEAVEQLLELGRRMCELRHPALVQLLDCGVHEGIPYLVNEQTEGVTLDAYCGEDSLLFRTSIAESLAGVAEGLEAAHLAGVVHGNIHPACMHRTNDGRVRLTGFGLVPDAESRAGRGVLRSLAYQSPEQIRGGPPDEGSDQFSLGAVIYELLAGQRAFPGDSESTVLYRIVNEPVRDPRGFDPPVEDGFAETVLRALAKRPKDRFATAGRLAEALNEASIALRVGESFEVEPAAPPAPAQPTMETPVAPATDPVVSPRVGHPRSSGRPYVLVGVLLAAAALAGWQLWPERGPEPPPAPSWLETRVRTEPAGAEVLLDGEPVEPQPDGLVRFLHEEPFGVLSATIGCRTAEHRLDPADAGGEVVLVLDPAETDVQINPGVDGARVLLNGDVAGTTPAELRLDLCRDNRVELQAKGYRTATVELPAGMQPLVARKLLYAIALERIPKGILALPRRRDVQLVYYVDGKRLASSATQIELEEGQHRLRYKNEFHWIDVRRQVSVEGGKTTHPGLEIELATLVVQAFPANCKVFVRRPGGAWKYMDETPAKRRVAIGEYEVKVQLNPTGETRVVDVELKPGSNPPVRVAFGGGR